MENLGQTVIVGYQDYDNPGYDERTQARVGRIVRAAHARYARHLARNGYQTKPWLRYDGVQLGLFVTGRH